MIETYKRSKKNRNVQTPIKRKKFQDSSDGTKEELLKHIFKKNRVGSKSKFEVDGVNFGFDSPFRKSKNKSISHILGETDKSKKLSFNDLKRKIVKTNNRTKNLPVTPSLTVSRKSRKQKYGFEHSSLVVNSPVSSPIITRESLEKIKLSIRNTPNRRKKENKSFFSPFSQKTLPSRTKMVLRTDSGTKLMKVYSKPPNLRNEGYDQFDEEIHVSSNSKSNDYSFGSPPSRPRFIEDRFMKDVMEIEKSKKRSNLNLQSLSKKKKVNERKLRPFTNPTGASRRLNQTFPKNNFEDREDKFIKSVIKKERPLTVSSSQDMGVGGDRFDESLSNLYNFIVYDSKEEKQIQEKSAFETVDLICDEKSEECENIPDPSGQGNISPISQNLEELNQPIVDIEKKGSSNSELPDFQFKSVGEPLKLQYDPTQVKQMTGLSVNVMNTTLKDYLIMVEACNRAGKAKLEGLCHYRIATMFEDKGNLKSSIKHFRKFLYLCQQVNDQVGMCLGLNRLGVLHQVRGGDGIGVSKQVSIRKSLKYHGEHWKLADIQNKIVAHINMGLLFMKYGKGVKEARDNFRAAIRYAIATGDKHGQAMALANLGVLKKVDGDFGMAKECITKQLAISTRIQDERSRTDAYQKLGVLASKKGDSEKAIKMLNKARKIAVEFNDQVKSNQIKCFLGILRGNQKVENHIRSLGDKMKLIYSENAKKYLELKRNREKQLERELKAAEIQREMNAKKMKKKMEEEQEQEQEQEQADEEESEGELFEESGGEGEGGGIGGKSEEIEGEGEEEEILGSEEKSENEENKIVEKGGEEMEEEEIIDSEEHEDDNIEEFPVHEVEHVENEEIQDEGIEEGEGEGEEIYEDEINENNEEEGEFENDKDLNNYEIDNGISL